MNAKLLFTLLPLPLSACLHDRPDPQEPAITDRNEPTPQASPLGRIAGPATPIAGTGPAQMDWSATTPLEFLDLLASGKHSLFTIWNPPPADWYTEEQLQGLIERLPSTAPAASVVSANSSILPLGPVGPDGTGEFKQSTEGWEAAYLINGFKNSRYPPTLGSLVRPGLSPKEALAWWKAREPGPATSSEL